MFQLFSSSFDFASGTNQGCTSLCLSVCLRHHLQLNKDTQPFEGNMAARLTVVPSLQNGNQGNNGGNNNGNNNNNNNNNGGSSQDYQNYESGSQFEEKKEGRPSQVEVKITWDSGKEEHRVQVKPD